MAIKRWLRWLFSGPEWEKQNCKAILDLNKRLKSAEASAVESVSTARELAPKYEAMQAHIAALEKLGEQQAAEIGRLSGAVKRLILIREHPADVEPPKPAKPIRTTHRTFTGVRNAVEGRDA